MRKRYLICLILLSYVALPAQVRERCQVSALGVEQGLLQSTISDFELDARGYCWVSFPNGLQYYDGVQFRDVPVQAGLPDDKFIRLHRSARGVLFVSHSQGISRYADSSKRFVMIYQSRRPGIPARFIGEEGDRLFFINEEGVLTYINTRNYIPGHSVHTGLRIDRPESNRICFSNIRDRHFAVIYRNRLYRWNLPEQRLTDSSGPVPRISYYFLHLNPEGNALYVRYDHFKSIHQYQFATDEHAEINFPEKEEHAIGRCQVFNWDNRPLISFNSNVFETSRDGKMLIRELRGLDGAPAGGPYTICAIKSDPAGNCWMQTVTGGLRRMSRSRFATRLYTLDSTAGCNVLSVCADKQAGRVLAGTVGNGLLIFDTLQRLQRHIQKLPGFTGNFTCNLVARIPTGGYLFISSVSNHFWKLSADLKTLTAIPVSTRLPPDKRGFHYFANLLYADTVKLLVQTQSRIYKVYPALNRASVYIISDEYIMSGCWSPPAILLHAGNQLSWLDTAGMQLQRQVPLPGTGYVRCFARNPEGGVYAGSNKGIFCLSHTGRVIRQWNRSTGLPDECVYAMATADDGKLWCSSNQGIFSVDTAGRVQKIKAADGLQGSEFNTNAVSAAEDGELFFGGVRGISSFYPGEIQTVHPRPAVWISGIMSNNQQLFPDTAAEVISRIVLPYERHSLSFSFTVTGHGGSEAYQCQYRMKGIDGAWIPGYPLQQIHYFLPPGSYELQLAAGDFFDPEAVPLKILQIVIRPPFWQTWWFYVLSVLLLLGIIIGSIHTYHQRRYRQKLRDMEALRKVQEERERISRELHDSIGAYANAVLYNAELLRPGDTEGNKDLIHGLKGLSKDIIHALRDNVWALKSSAFTSEECLLRIRNFVQSLNRYYYTVDIMVEGEAPVRTLDSAHALHLIRIVQEALANAVKHASASVIRVESTLEEGRWRLCVSDNGTGFETSRPPGVPDSNGLAHMRERAAEAGFGFSIVSEKDTGTRVCILV